MQEKYFVVGLGKFRVNSFFKEGTHFAYETEPSKPRTQTTQQQCEMKLSGCRQPSVLFPQTHLREPHEKPTSSELPVLKTKF